MKAGLIEGGLGSTWNTRFWRRNEFYLGTWNILSLYQAGALRILLDQVDKYKTEITAIQEVGWFGQGVLEKGDHAVLGSCYRAS